MRKSAWRSWPAPCLNGGQDADDLLLGDLQSASEGVVRRAVRHSGADQVAAAHQQAGALRAANDLAAAVRHQVRALRDVRVGHDEVVGRGVHQDRDAGRFGDGRDVLEVELGLAEVIPEQLDHGRMRADGGPQFLRRIDLDHGDAERAHGVVVPVARFLGDDHLVLQPFEVGQALDLLRIGARQHAGRGMRQRGSRSRRDQHALHLEQFGEAGAGLIHQLLDIHVEVRGLLHGGDHLGQRQGAAVDGEGRGAVDERPDTDPGVDLRAGTGGGCRGGGFEAGDSGGSETTRLKQTASADVHMALLA